MLWDCFCLLYFYHSYHFLFTNTHLYMCDISCVCILYRESLYHCPTGSVTIGVTHSEVNWEEHTHIFYQEVVLFSHTDLYTTHIDIFSRHFFLPYSNQYSYFEQKLPIEISHLWIRIQNTRAL